MNPKSARLTFLRRIACVSLLSGVALAFVTPVGATPIPTPQLQFWINSTPEALPPIPGTPTGDPNVFEWNSGTISTPTYTLDISNVTEADPFVTNNVILSNNSGSTNNYVFLMTLPVSAQLPITDTGGSVQAGLTSHDIGGGTLSTINASTPLYMSIIDGTDFHSLLNNWSTTVPSFGSSVATSSAFGLSAATDFYGPPANTSIAIRIAFSLTSGETATISSVFEVIPAPEPGTITLLGLGLAGMVFVARRRKR